MLHFVKQTVCLVATRKHAQIRCIKKEAQRSAPLTLRQGSDLRRRPRARFDLVWIFFLGRQQLSEAGQVVGNLGVARRPG